ncbi:hypothetical protein CY34DRAFT_801720 [Suillus luteus UH-Slu-Lm8-n1]|uniref:Uncharacterized protein n=1 Tax=Suillus luteus UH-Slu-Lm8-n1 TaxID=930992 RepID=A0A0D0BQI5_9AGAM|nr:hypothetical protein CY34DRAFT_801720 [Suillus luteus UH-Slu-Lm8-n1]
MYQRSRKILTFLIITFLAINVFNVALAVITVMHASGEELILSGTYQCSFGSGEQHLDSISWALTTVWEVLTLCLAVWVAVKHFRELRRHSAGRIIGDCFTVLIKTHILYFVSFLAASCLQLIFDWSPTLSANYSQGPQIYTGFLQIVIVVQMFMLGPRLILDVREYHAKLVAESNAASGMTSIVFQERVHISTSSSV